MVHHIYAVNNAGAKKIRGWHLKPKHYVEKAFSYFQCFKEKINFWKYSGAVYSFWRLFCKRKATRETTLRSNRTENQTLKRHKIRFPRQSLANAQTLFSSVISWFLQPESVKVSLQSRHSGKMSAHAFNQREFMRDKE